MIESTMIEGRSIGSTRIDQLLVPIDRSDQAWRAFDLACTLAPTLGAKVSVVEVVAFDDIVTSIAERLVDECEVHAATALERTDHLVVETTVMSAIDVTEALLAQLHRNTLVVMASHGRGRTAGLVGSVATDLIARGSSPVLCVGPSVSDAHLAGERWSGPVVVTVDGSHRSEEALPEAARWADALGVEPWIVEVHEPSCRSMVDVLETNYSARLARSLGTEATVQYEALHGHHVAETVARFADDLGAAMIVAATQGRTGLDRLVLGSTAAGMVRHAPCPVLLVNRHAGTG